MQSISNLPKINKHQSKTDLTETPRKNTKPRKSQFDSIMHEIMNQEENGLKANHNSHVSPPQIQLLIFLVQQRFSASSPQDDQRASK